MSDHFGEGPLHSAGEGSIPGCVPERFRLVYWRSPLPSSRADSRNAFSSAICSRPPVLPTQEAAKAQATGSPAKGSPHKPVGGAPTIHWAYAKLMPTMHAKSEMAKIAT